MSRQLSKSIKKNVLTAYIGSDLPKIISVTDTRWCKKTPPAGHVTSNGATNLFQHNKYIAMTYKRLYKSGLRHPIYPKKLSKQFFLSEKKQSLCPYTR